MNTKKIDLSITTLLVAVVTFAALPTASAGDFYISTKISSATSSHEIERNTEGVVLPVPDVGSVSTVEDTSFSAGLALGYTQDIGEGDLFWGIEGFYDHLSSSSRNINGVLITDIDLNASYGGRILLGTKVSERFSFYVHGGVTVLDFDIRNSYTFAPPVKEGSDDSAGFSYGYGAIYDINDKVSAFLDFSQVNDVGFDGLPEVAGGTDRVNPNDLGLNSLSLGLKYKF